MEGMVVHEGRLSTFDQVELFWRKDQPGQPRAVLIVVHGLAEHSGRYEYLAQRLNRAGWGVYRFDHRGHGRSGGERAYVENFMQFVEDTALVVDLAGRENPGVPLFMFGHSMGGLVAAVYGIRYRGALAGQVFSGALTREPAGAAQLKNTDFAALPATVKVPNALSGLISRDEEVVRAYQDDPLVLKEVSVRLLGEISINGPAWLDAHVREYQGPCLVLHGGADRIVDPEAARWFHAQVSSADKELRIYDGLYHEILNEREKEAVIDDVIRWLEKRLPPVAG